jgi:hypothetical protein
MTTQQVPLDGVRPDDTHSTTEGTPTQLGTEVQHDTLLQLADLREEHGHRLIKIHAGRYTRKLHDVIQQDLQKEG